MDKLKQLLQWLIPKEQPRAKAPGNKAKQPNRTSQTLRPDITHLSSHTPNNSKHTRSPLLPDAKEPTLDEVILAMNNEILELETVIKRLERIDAQVVEYKVKRLYQQLFVLNKQLLTLYLRKIPHKRT